MVQVGTWRDKKPIIKVAITQQSSSKIISRKRGGNNLRRHRIVGLAEFAKTKHGNKSSDDERDDGGAEETFHALSWQSGQVPMRVRLVLEISK